MELTRSKWRQKLQESNAGWVGNKLTTRFVTAKATYRDRSAMATLPIHDFDRWKRTYQLHIRELQKPR